MKIGDIFGRWKVIDFEDNGYVLCECQCSNHTIKSVKQYTLIKGTSKSCGCLRKELNSKNKIDDLTGRSFGEWSVLRYAGSSMWVCKCSCGNIMEVKAQSLKSGVSKSCGHNTTGFKDLSGRKINHWNVLEYCGNGMYKCQCDCAEHTIKIISRANLVTGMSKSCGCGHSGVKLIDLTGQRFGKLVAIKYIGNKFWKCVCTECSNVSIHNGEHLRRNKENFKCERCDSNIISRDEVISKIDNITEKLGRKPVRYEVAEELNVGVTTVARYIDRYGIGYKIDSSCKSIAEKELRVLFPSAIVNDRKALGNGKELDLYFPDRKIAIEFNGGYWHSDIYKNSRYHQDKILLAEQNGIHLINIYEYEWHDSEYRTKIVNFIKRAIDNNINKIYAHNTEVKEIDNNVAYDFLNKYHLQKSVNADIHLGIFEGNELLGVMTLGIPRFDTEYQYELLRIAYKDNIVIEGGTEKLFNYFVDKYKPSSIVSYCNIDIFSGRVYNRLGMTLDLITEPGYVWWNCKIGDKSSLLSMYKTNKSKLVEMGLGNLGNTEDEIMRKLGYYKIYNGGNKKYIWTSSET